MDTQETSVYTAVLISCIVIGIIIIYFVVSLIRQQRKNIELARQNILTELSTMERERARIAVDLHDDLGPILSVIKFNIDNAAEQNDDRELLEKSSEYINTVISRLREISNDLMPTSLLRKGLIPSIQEFITTVELSSNIKIDVEVESIIELSENIRINIYRIIKEVLHNSIKHAQASNITIHFSMKDDELIIHYIENGIGFNYETALAESPGFGLRNLTARVEIMGGSVVVESKAGKGTAFLFNIPIK